MTQLSLESLRLVSYNCRGWNSGHTAVFDLLQSNDICFIQEHWLFEEQLNLLNIHNDFLSSSVSGMESHTLLHGRPFGGCAILYRKSLIPHVARLSSCSKRFCSVLLTDHRGSTTLLICVYLPFCDGSAESSNQFLITLGELEGFIARHECDHLLIAGDFNTDFNRNNVNLRHLQSFMSDLNLVSADLSHQSSIQFTYLRDDGAASSWPDHYLCDLSLAGHLSHFRRFDFGSNLSDHSPLLCSLRADLSAPCPSSPTSPTPSVRIAWHAVTPDLAASYCSLLSSNLPPLPDSVRDCCEPSCTQHHAFLDGFCEQLSRCLYDSALASFPLVKQSSSVPGWNNGARLLKEKANFWHAVWCKAGSPSVGVLHQIKRSAKSRYKYEVRRLKRREQYIRREKMAAALASSNSKNFWHQVHCVNQSKKPSPVSSVDGVSGASRISQLFSDKLQSVLNSCDCADRDAILSSLQSSLSSEELAMSVITEECVLDAFSHLKRGKGDGTSLASDHWVYALPALSSSLASLFTAILRHGYMPQQLRNCVLLPIPKGNKDQALSESYRPIALASTLSKALEWCILLSYPQLFFTSGLQFGFKPKMSTSLCTGTVKCVISRYMHGGSSVFACFLDASKAFDLVNHEILFQRLIDRDLPNHLTRFLLSWYKNQSMSVKWGESLSEPFSVSNGVRQGGVLSPILFTMYIDDLLVDLSNLGVGCFWDSLFAGALCYADDLVLLAPSPAALRIMLRCCENFALKRGLRFNASKTQLIRFSSSPSSSCAARLHLCGHELPFLDTVTHLGHILQYNLSDTPDINLKLKDMVKKANYLFASFPRVGPSIMTRLFQSYCLSLHGSSLWSLSSPALRNIEVAFNKILRKIWHLHYRSHTAIVHLVAKLVSLFNLVYRRSNSLLFAASKAPSMLVRVVFRDSANVCYSFSGYNKLFGVSHIKSYDTQYQICANVIRAIRCCSSPHKDFEDMIYTISCD